MARVQGDHDVDRDIPEALQELRVAQTGGQVFFAFLFSVAFAPGFSELDDGQRILYGWTLFVVASATTVLIAPVAVHRWNFGMDRRPQMLVATHILASCGLALLAIGSVMGMLLISSVVFPDSVPWLAVGSAVLVTVSWLALPATLHILMRPLRAGDRKR